MALLTQDRNKLDGIGRAFFKKNEIPVCGEQPGYEHSTAVHRVAV